MLSRLDLAIGVIMINEIRQPRILALIPAHNESGRIGPVIDGVKAHLPVLVIDDGSRDDTSDVARAHGAEVFGRNQIRAREQRCLMDFNYFLAGEYDAIITLDADGQHDPAEIPLFVEKFERPWRPDYREAEFPPDALPAQLFEYHLAPGCFPMP